MDVKNRGKKTQVSTIVAYPEALCSDNGYHEVHWTVYNGRKHEYIDILQLNKRLKVLSCK